MALDKIDSKIIEELFYNARNTNSQIGAKIGASKEVVNYRINRLTSEGIITQFIPLINFSKLGYTIYRVQLKFNKKDKEKWRSFFNKIPQASWLAELQGSWDVVFLFWIKTNKEFFQILDQINEEFNENIQDLLFTIVDTIYHLPPKFAMAESKELNSFCYKTSIEENVSIELKEIETKIIRELMKDGRMSVLSIAKNIGSSATNVTHHIKKLQKNGVIEAFIPVIDHTKLGLTHFKITMQLLNTAQKLQMREKLMQSRKTLYITESYGRYDIEFEFVAEKIEELFSFIEQLEIPIKHQEIIFNNKLIKVNEMPF